MLKIYVAVNVGGSDVGLALIYLVRRVENVKNTLGARKSGENGGVLVGYHVYRPRELFGVLEHSLYRAYRDISAAEHEETAKARNENILQVADKVHYRSHNGAPDARAYRAAAEFVGYRREFFDRLRLLAVGDDRRVARHHLLNLPVELTEKRLLTDKVFAHEFCKHRGYYKSERNGEYRYKRYGGAEPQHHHNSADNGYNTGEQRGQRLRYSR